ncbi:DUF2922 domain-containing protein [Halalkalibacter hemicellulosilyticus]|uniref:DUF2922 domain-containing protein n=1 Tax=Halalkalibacter hemicellulosilyticusJCM 9152 TaxID=1236971 RepID=W4QGH7_9BACI|nr:DUF2922 domain-containing protein [Halalkalibacter hemicellulosilyticus]GAE30763.1 hypothetical protein JCM9152_2179 [Halalkalibacter hemicellulosilyticusJCM 9152]
MSKRLELQFENEEGRLVTISVDDPIEPVDGELISQSMNQILAEDAIESNGGNLVAIRGARIVERNVTDIELP